MQSFKVRFSIQEEGKEKEYFTNLKEAEIKTNIPSKHIYKFLRNKKLKYQRKTDGIFALL